MFEENVKLFKFDLDSISFASFQKEFVLSFGNIKHFKYDYIFIFHLINRIIKLQFGMGKSKQLRVVERDGITMLYFTNCTQIKHSQDYRL